VDVGPSGAKVASHYWSWDTSLFIHGFENFPEYPGPHLKIGAGESKLSKFRLSMTLDL
jgi:hypothetical protein